MINEKKEVIKFIEIYNNSLDKFISFNNNETEEILIAKFEDFFININALLIKYSKFNSTNFLLFQKYINENNMHISFEKMNWIKYYISSLCKSNYKDDIIEYMNCLSVYSLNIADIIFLIKDLTSIYYFDSANSLITKIEFFINNNYNFENYELDSVLDFYAIKNLIEAYNDFINDPNEIYKYVNILYNLLKKNDNSVFYNYEYYEFINTLFICSTNNKMVSAASKYDSYCDLLNFLGISKYSKTKYEEIINSIRGNEKNFYSFFLNKLKNLAKIFDEKKDIFSFYFYSIFIMVIYKKSSIGKLDFELLK